MPSEICLVCFNPDLGCLSPGQWLLFDTEQFDCFFTVSCNICVWFAPLKGCRAKPMFALQKSQGSERGSWLMDRFPPQATRFSLCAWNHALVYNKWKSKKAQQECLSLRRAERGFVWICLILSVVSTQRCKVHWMWMPADFLLYILLFSCIGVVIWKELHWRVKVTLIYSNTAAGRKKKL